ncbi:SRPBCC domain-containing protein [Temperatibacter marinus]|uniref:SRPBCC domain-containing protein n=1 Tax=Temperatibacter marinus TaxID=1456591 RepID=A0AA52EEP5_9PROT|nr:SRPBCC domain-containing protein [Temperatibacter marinus]WND01435.1 SRPBCC domain-containing protein [Temperatibacter marinus]
MNAIDLTTTPVLEITKVFKVSPARVFEAFITPSLMKQWWGPASMTVPLCELDAKLGGKWKTMMVNDEGEEFTVSGVYTKINSPIELEFTWAWLEDGQRGQETTVNLKFTAVENGTRLDLVQGSFSDGCQAHHEGWMGGLTNLEELLA